MHSLRRQRTLGTQGRKINLFMATSPKSGSFSATPASSTIESSLGRLGEIVEEIEQTPPPLDILIERYAEGMKLLENCREKLDAAERRIEVITRSARGEPELEPFPES